MAVILERYYCIFGDFFCFIPRDGLIERFHCISLFSQARDVYEEAIQTVITVRDFTQVFEAYTQLEENMISAKMETTAEHGPTEDGKSED